MEELRRCLHPPIRATGAVQPRRLGDLPKETTAVAFTISTIGTAALTVQADAKSEDYQWQWEVTGNLVSGGPFEAVAGAYSATISGQQVQGIPLPNGWFYSSSPHHSGGGICQFSGYGKSVEQQSLGHSAVTLTLNASATIDGTGTGSDGSTLNFTLKRVDTLP